MIPSENLIVSSVLLLIFNGSLVLSLKFLALRIDLLDYPSERKTHVLPTPLVGGLAVYLTLCALVAINNDWGSDIGMIITFAGLIVLIGLVDDFITVRWPIRLIVQSTAALCVISTTNIVVINLGNYPIVGLVELGWVGAAFTIFSVTCTANSFNLVDGIDGLCGGLILLVVTALQTISYVHSGQINFYFLTLVGSISIFLFFNLSQNPKRKIFMGDAGSAGLGFIVSFLIIAQLSSEHISLPPPFALWLLLVPIADTLFVIWKRIRGGRSIFQPGSDHFHHCLRAKGYSQSKTLAVLLTIAFLGIIGGLLFNSEDDVISVCMFMIVVFCLMKYAEVNKTS